MRATSENENITKYYIILEKQISSHKLCNLLEYLYKYLFCNYSCQLDILFIIFLTQKSF